MDLQEAVVLPQNLLGRLQIFLILHELRYFAQNNVSLKAFVDLLSSIQLKWSEHAGRLVEVPDVHDLFDQF